MPEVLHNSKLKFQIREDLFCFYLSILLVTALQNPLGLLSLSFKIENHYLTCSIPTSICLTDKIIVCRWAVSIWVYAYINNRIFNRTKSKSISLLANKCYDYHFLSIPLNLNILLDLGHYLVNFIPSAEHWNNAKHF